MKEIDFKKEYPLNYNVIKNEVHSLVSWECIRCKKINAPDVKSCSCVHNESHETDQRILLNE